MPFESPGRGKGRKALGWAVPNRRSMPALWDRREVFSRLHLRATPPGRAFLRSSRMVELNGLFAQGSPPTLGPRGS